MPVEKTRAPRFLAELVESDRGPLHDHFQSFMESCYKACVRRGQRTGFIGFPRFVCPTVPSKWKNSKRKGLFRIRILLPAGWDTLAHA